jgi:hypothetical protein
MLKMIIPKIPNNISGHKLSSDLKKPRQFPINSTGKYIKIKVRFAAMAHRFDLGLPLRTIHHAIPETTE